MRIDKKNGRSGNIISLEKAKELLLSCSAVKWNNNVAIPIVHSLPGDSIFFEIRSLTEYHVFLSKDNQHIKLIDSNLIVNCQFKGTLLITLLQPKKTWTKRK